MVTWAEHIARRRRHWHLEARIAGLGLPLTDEQLTAVDNDGRYRLCPFRPRWAAATGVQGLWLPLMADPLPPLQGEEGDPLGGLPNYPASVSVFVNDKSRGFSALYKPDAAPVALLAVAMDEVATELQAGVNTLGSPALTVGQVYWLEGEALRVESIVDAGDLSTPTTYGVTRGFLGTTIEPHTAAGLDIYARCHQLIGAAIELWAGPANGAAADMRRLVTATITSIPLHDEATTWELVGQSDASQRLSKKGTLKRQLTITEFFFDGSFKDAGPSVLATDEFGVLQGFVLQWTGGQELSPLLYAQTDDGEVVGLSNDPGGVFNRGYLTVISRDLLGVGSYKAIDSGTTLTQVFFDNSWRYSPASEGPVVGAAAMHDADGFVISRHVVDLFLIIATSPSSPLEAVGVNYSALGNWSTLPGGYGLGIPCAQLDIAGMLELKAKHPELVMDYAVWGNDDRPAFEALDEMLKAAGIRLHTTDLLSMTMARMPTSSEELPLLDASNTLSQPGDGKGVLVPAVRDVKLARAPFGQVKVLVGPTKRETTLKSRGAQNVEVQMQWVANETPFVAQLVSRMALLGRDAIELEIDVSPSLFMSLTWGSMLRYSLPRPTSMADDGPPPERLAEVMNLRLEQTRERGITGTLALRVYPRFLLSSLIGPSARVTLVVDSTNVQLTVQDYSLATGGTDDGGQFMVGDVLALYNHDGSRVGSGVETVVAFAAPIDMELSGDFSGAIVAGHHLGYPPFDEATANDVQSLFLFLSSLNTRSPSAADLSIVPGTWGTP